MSSQKPKHTKQEPLKKRPQMDEALEEDLAEFEAEELSGGPADDHEFDNFEDNDFDEAAPDEFDDIEDDDLPPPEAPEGFDDAQEEHKTPALLEMEKQIQEADTEYLNGRVQEVLERLGNSKTNKLHPGERVHLLIELRKIFCKLFNYNNELMEYIMGLFSPAEAFAFLEMMETSRPVTIRVNSLKTQKAALVKSLTERGVNLEPLDEVCKMAFKINQSKVPIGATPEYLAGHYMLQSAASMLPVRALAPQPGECILDMAAAPGGKTTHIGQIMKNKGVIVANDFKKDRTKALFYNCQRMGLNNVVITNFDGRKFPNSLKKFDRVLLDAPCTGLGVISRDQSIKVKRNMMDIYKAAHLQKELLRKALDLCKVGGYVVYSTCSFAVEENEGVVDYVLRKRYAKLVDTGLEVESKVYTKYKEHRFNDRMKYCVRVFPHVHNLDGFFVAKLLKTKEGIRGADDEDEGMKVEEAQNGEEEDSDQEEAEVAKGKAKARPKHAPARDASKDNSGAQATGNGTKAHLPKKQAAEAKPAQKPQGKPKPKTQDIDDDSSDDDSRKRRPKSRPHKQHQEKGRKKVH